MLFDLISKSGLQNIINHFEVATSLSLRVVDSMGKEILRSKNCKTEFCDCLKDKKKCKKSYVYGGEKSKEINEPYIFACHLGFILCSVPLIEEGKVLGSIIAGPFLLWDWDIEAQRELEEKFGSKLSEKMIDKAQVIPQIACTNMHAVAQLLFLVCNNLIKSQIEIEKNKELLKSREARIIELLTESALQKNEHLSRATDFIKKNYANPLKLESVAKACFISSYYLSHLFSSQLSTTFSKYVIKIRMENAERLLKETNLKVLDIAYAVGYCDNAYFTKQFFKHFGKNPKEFRN